MKNLIKTAMIVAVGLTLGACSIFGGDKGGKNIEPKTTALGVNGYLWQATLDTLDFMSVSSSDPSAGFIVTEWHTDPNSKDERIKVTVRFLTEQLRSDGLKVIVVRQKNMDGSWVNQDVAAGTELRIQDAILLAARNLKQGINN
ncbi:DUF3576 domain-containing protein [Temperatibacter marinus]|uniref:DUF3576 domain-containing protein n=1 Tax=Temperatibacter marinus TaxID=1456591 RepID=A0AA52H9Z1_9PROT|nr:DUF3576 domain-containing protein [Temperatibacter marinus]WND03696.1 DUF3576 domain-containing protein [Temperatibacter marinus]